MEIMEVMAVVMAVERGHGRWLPIENRFRAINLHVSRP